jgi:hypothetical protein
MTVFEIQKGLKTKKLIEDPSLIGKQQENEPGNTGYFQVGRMLTPSAGRQFN